MKLTVGILTWGAQKTLNNSVDSWERNGIFDLANEIIFFHQEQETSIPYTGNNYKLRHIVSPTNIGIAQGYKRLVEETTSDLFLFLENDWPVSDILHKKSVQYRLIQAMTLLDLPVTDVVRLRHRTDHGYPLWTLQFQGNELSRPEHLLDSIHWTDPAKISPLVWETGSEHYSTLAQNANWTNNPTMFKTEFLKKNILPRIGEGDAEKDLQSWWQQQSFVVTQGEGIFKHYRVD